METHSVDNAASRIDIIEHKVDEFSKDHVTKIELMKYALFAVVTLLPAAMYVGYLGFTAYDNIPKQIEVKVQDIVRIKVDEYFKTGDAQKRIDDEVQKFVDSKLSLSGADVIIAKSTEIIQKRLDVVALGSAEMQKAVNKIAPELIDNKISSITQEQLVAIVNRIANDDRIKELVNKNVAYHDIIRKLIREEMPGSSQLQNVKNAVQTATNAYNAMEYGEAECNQATADPQKTTNFLKRNVRFRSIFQSVPVVFVSINSIGLEMPVASASVFQGGDGVTNLSVTADNIKQTGFDLRFAAQASLLKRCKITWIAIPQLFINHN